MAKHRGLGAATRKAVDAGRRSARTDLRIEEEGDRARDEIQRLALARIKDRAFGNAREIDDKHVETLVESIKVLGLLQPVLVDRRHRLIAGGHRLAAFRALHAAFGEPWSHIPVVVDSTLDTEKDPELALRKELAENEKRKNLSKTEVLTCANRLLEAGYKRQRGRLPTGDRALTPALASAFGVSVRYVRKLLNEDPENKPEQVPVYGDKKRALRSLRKRIQLLLDGPLLDEETRIRKDAERLLKSLDASRVLTTGNAAPKRSRRRPTSSDDASA